MVYGCGMVISVSVVDSGNHGADWEVSLPSSTGEDQTTYR